MSPTLEFTPQEVGTHNHRDSLWVTYLGKVYDITTFAEDHPGGIDYILEFAGEDIGEVMKDPAFHHHSESAYELLSEYCIGTLKGANGISCSPRQETHALVDTDIQADYKTEHFLDLSRPLFLQMLRSNFTKEFYMEQVHKPRYLSYPAPFFGRDSYFELLSMTPWYVVPVLWLPRVAWYAWHGYDIIQSWTTVASYMVLGLVLWSLLEYVLHRFVFHIEKLLPDHPLALTLHFTLHGVHHYLPMDRLRLVMPPALGFVLAYPLLQMGFAAFPPGIANALIAGTISGYIGYDLTHYYLHHGCPFFQHLRAMKTYHLAHHYKNFNLGFGVTVKIWDRFFGTFLPVKD
ncbi:fatty acid alpha-hydroxylase [Dispira simplex]|nr:fatty acid alpha-hydroxylase [Dispira simplex]